MRQIPAAYSLVNGVTIQQYSHPGTRNSVPMVVGGKPMYRSRYKSLEDVPVLDPVNWVNGLSPVEYERRQIFESVLLADKGIPAEGRLWISCAYCPDTALPSNDNTPTHPISSARSEHGGFVLTVCGTCERQDEAASGAGNARTLRIRRENTKASPVYRAIETWCASSS